MKGKVCRQSQWRRNLFSQPPHQDSNRNGVKKDKYENRPERMSAKNKIADTDKVVPKRSDKKTFDTAGLRSLKDNLVPVYNFSCVNRVPALVHSEIKIIFQERKNLHEKAQKKD